MKSEMLEALKIALAWLEKNSPPWSATSEIGLLRQTIAKAEGEGT
jgi:hypothetical protein